MKKGKGMLGVRCMYERQSINVMEERMNRRMKVMASENEGQLMVYVQWKVCVIL